MRYRITQIIFLVFLTIAVSSSFAVPPSRQSLEELVTASGLDTDLKSLEQNLVTSAVEAAMKNAPQDESTEGLIDILLAENLRETFQYSLLLDEVTHFLKKQISEEDVQQALGWYRSDLGKRIVQAEAISGSSKGMATIQSEKDELLKQQDLINIASEVDDTIGISDAMVDIQINAQKALILASLAITAPGKDLSELENANWHDIKTADRDSLRQPISQNYKATFAYTMKAFSPDERAQYREFMLNPSNVKIVNAIITGISKAVEIGAHNFVMELKKDVKNPPPELQQLISQNSAPTATAETTTQNSGNNANAAENSDW
ncbi:MAG: DUF2059 domain-containing protein [Candidatus Thiodiazotropha sp.]